MMAWKMFFEPITLSFDSLLWLLMPLCAAVAIIYKTVRTQNIRRLYLEIIVLIVYMFGGLIALGAALWLVHEYWPF